MTCSKSKKLTLLTKDLSLMRIQSKKYVKKRLPIQKKYNYGSKQDSSPKENPN